MSAKEEDSTKSASKAEELPGLTPAVPLGAPMMSKSPSVKRDMNRFPEKVWISFAFIWIVIIFPNFD